MRTIKFRAWDTETKTMTYGIPVDWFLSAKTIEQVLNEKSEYRYMQFTGLKDKNDKEIYESDIVRIDWQDSRYEPVIAVITWDEKEASWDIGGGSVSEVNWSHEVIGNIYKHPNLLEK